MAVGRQEPILDLEAEKFVSDDLPRSLKGPFREPLLGYIRQYLRFRTYDLFLSLISDEMSCPLVIVATIRLRGGKNKIWRGGVGRLVAAVGRTVDRKCVKMLHFFLL